MAEEINELGIIAIHDANRCEYSIHANGDWADYRCELVRNHNSPHAIGLIFHAVPLITQLEAKINQLQKDAAPFQAQIDQLKSYKVTNIEENPTD